MSTGLLIILSFFLFLFFKTVIGIRSFFKVGYIGVDGSVGISAPMFHSIVERNIQILTNALYRPL